MDRADLLAFPPTRIVRRRMTTKRKSRKQIVEVVEAKKHPVLIFWTGLIMIVRLTVPPAIYVLAGGSVYRWLGL
jgi:hypothetical protein